jgi:hypothetical protein
MKRCISWQLQIDKLVADAQLEGDSSASLHQATLARG